MNSIKIVNDLHTYLSLLNKIEAQEIDYYKLLEKPIPANFSKSVSLGYNTLTISLNYKTEDGERHPDYFWTIFTVEDQNVSIKNLGCIHNERENIIREYVLNHIPKTFPSTPETNILDKETEQYLNIADEIAKQAYLCSSGDHYHPGFFSKISVDEAGIILQQINHWNARSIDHKKDYHLRNLEFYIPNLITESKLSFRDEKIGRMTIHFSDRSSENNKNCGDKIFSKIQEQKALFEKGTSKD